MGLQRLTRPVKAGVAHLRRHGPCTSFSFVGRMPFCAVGLAMVRMAERTPTAGDISAATPVTPQGGSPGTVEKQGIDPPFDESAQPRCLSQAEGHGDSGL